MNARTRRWLVWLLAAWLPLAGIGAAQAGLSMADDFSAAATVTQADSQPGCHAAATDDPSAAAPCCDTAACLCNCSAPANALPAVPPAGASIPPLAGEEPRQPLVASVPLALPFRPPIA